jgi:hypothetical protein
MTHQQKIKLARKMLSRDEHKKNTPIFESNGWESRKLSIKKRILNKLNKKLEK